MADQDQQFTTNQNPQNDQNPQVNQNENDDLFG